jgi:hypothetical protein
MGSETQGEVAGSILTTLSRALALRPGLPGQRTEDRPAVCRRRGRPSLGNAQEGAARASESYCGSRAALRPKPGRVMRR